MIDIGSHKMLAHESIANGTALPVRSSVDINPWNVLSATDKVTSLDRILEREIGRALPVLLKEAAR